MKKLLFVMMMLMASFSLYAQTISHTVQRGETIASVAKKYGVSVEDLKKANPMLKDYFYSGMTLSIPATKVISVQSSTEKQSSTFGITDKSKGKEKKTKSDKTSKHRSFFNSSLDGSDFRSAGIIFGSDFSDLVGLTYGVEGQYFLKNNFGATLIFGLNHGIEKKSDMVIKIGPSYVYPINDWLYIMGTACYTLSIAEGKGGSGNVSGASFIPTIGFAVKHFRIGLNGEVHWRNGGGVGPGAFLNLSYSF